MKKVTIKKIAFEAGVDPSTVSRALQNDPTISTDTCKKIKKIAEKLNYYPDLLARSLRKNKSNVIGIILDDPKNPFYTEILYAISEVLYKKDYSMIVCYSNYDTDRERKNIFSLLSSRVDGIIISPIEDKSKNIKILIENKVKTVIIDAYPYFKNISYVYTDNFKASKIAVEYLIDNGHKEILLFQGPVYTSLFEQFKSGYITTLQKYGIRPNKNLILVAEELSINGGYSNFKELILRKYQSKTVSFTAIVTISDLLAVGLYKALNEMGYRIPDDFSIVGYDNIKIFQCYGSTINNSTPAQKKNWY